MVNILTEGLESFGGIGYIESTGIPQILRDGMVLPIWEGTTNVLSVDFSKDLSKNFEKKITII